MSHLSWLFSIIDYDRYDSEKGKLKKVADVKVLSSDVVFLVVIPPATCR